MDLDAFHREFLDFKAQVQPILDEWNQYQSRQTAIEPFASAPAQPAPPSDPAPSGIPDDAGPADPNASPEAPPAPSAPPPAADPAPAADQSASE